MRKQEESERNKKDTEKKLKAVKEAKKSADQQLELLRE